MLNVVVPSLPGEDAFPATLAIVIAGEAVSVDAPTCSMVVPVVVEVIVMPEAPTEAVTPRLFWIAVARS
jgi:hypothetical protein